MDRQIIYAGQVPLETDLLNTNRNTMTAIAKLAAAMFGTGTVVNGLAVTQTTVASMQVQVAPGEIYMLANLDGTAYSSLAADTTHQILKQGISLDNQLLTLVAPGTVGFSINYLIEATYTESDTTAVVLPYYNASNPSTAYSGPANAGTTNNTKRQGLVTLQAKAGTAATTGTQSTPAPDSGYVGVAVVTVAYGAVSVVNANISAYPSAPYINRVGNYQSLSSISGAQTLTSASLGQTLLLGGAGGYTVTLPLANSCPAGTSLVFAASAGSITVSRQGSDLIYPNSSGTTGVVLNNGDNLTLVSSGSAWFAIGGTAVLGNALQSFGNSLAGNGYQKLPTGLIIQWGTVGVTATGNAATFPIAFPTAVYSLALGQGGTGIPANCYSAVNTVSLTGFTASSNAATPNLNWIAIGK